MSKTEDVTAKETTAKEKPEKSKLVVASQVRALIRDKGCCVATDLVDALSHKVEQILQTAILRCEANGRKTVRPADL